MFVSSWYKLRTLTHQVIDIRTPLLSEPFMLHMSTTRINITLWIRAFDLFSVLINQRNFMMIVEDGMWSAWSDYSSCSLTCGGGVQSRSRSCNDPVPNKYGQNCTGSNLEQIACNNLNCSSKINSYISNLKHQILRYR